MVKWRASDSDGDTLTYAVQYSADGGQSWSLLAAGLDTSAFELDTATIAGSKQGLIRVYASDGFHTAVDQSDATFDVAKNPPRAFILQDGEQVIPPGTPVTPLGVGLDNEDGAIAEGTGLYGSRIGMALLARASRSWYLLCRRVRTASP